MQQEQTLKRALSSSSAGEKARKIDEESGPHFCSATVEAGIREDLCANDETVSRTSRSQQPADPSCSATSISYVFDNRTLREAVAIFEDFIGDASSFNQSLNQWDVSSKDALQLAQQTVFGNGRKGQEDRGWRTYKVCCKYSGQQRLAVGATRKCTHRDRRLVMEGVDMEAVERRVTIGILECPCWAWNSKRSEENLAKSEKAAVPFPIIEMLGSHLSSIVAYGGGVTLSRHKRAKNIAAL
eukprot:gene26569-32110_t